jgi:prepilin signal peptidase PulO-like enzyme (type II secretory pathway)
VNQLLAIPIEGRLGVLFVLGACAGSLANWAIYALAFHPRPISPLSRLDPKAPPRRLLDRVPILGWLLLRHEAELHGRGFWVRPMLLELLLGLGFAALYWWEVDQLGLLPAGLAARPAPAWLMLTLHGIYLAHALLLWLMLAASMIDVDEKTIPDAITVPGTWLGLLLAAVVPLSLLPVATQAAGGPTLVMFLHLTFPLDWPAALNGFPQTYPLLLGLGCWWLWCLALMPRAWYGRYGWRRAWRYFVARLVREPATYWLLLMGLLGSGGVTAAWFVGGLHWVGLLTALVGMAAGGGLVWLVRVIGGATLGREAMGFGDVTLMAMIGAFLGWQTCLLIFFLAPLAGLLVGLIQLILFREHEIPYGPFLCLAALGIVVRWDVIWPWAEPIFRLGWFVPAVVLLCMALMGVMLGLWRIVRTALGGR